MASQKVIVGLLAGVAIGALAGLLLAPDKGKQTRKKISNKGNEIADDLKCMFDEFVENVSEKFNSTKEDAEKMARNAKKSAEQSAS